MLLGSLDPKRGGPARGGAWAAIVVLVFGTLIQSFSAAEFVFAQPLVIAVACVIAALSLAWTCFLGLGQLWSVATRRVVVGIAGLLVVVAGLLGYRALGDVGEERGARIAESFNVPGSPLTGVYDARNRLLLAADRTGLLRGFDIETNLQVGRSQRIGRSIGALAFRRGFLYATVNDGELARVEFGPVPRRPLRVRYGSENGHIAIGDNSIWVNDRPRGRILRFSFDLELMATIPLGVSGEAEATSLAFGGPDLLWVTDSTGNAIYRIDPRTNAVVVSKSVLGDPSKLDIQGNVVYVVHPEIGALVKHDALTGDQLRGVTKIGPGPGSLTVTAGRIFVCDVRGNRVLQLSLATGERTGALATGLSPTDIIVGPDGKMWVMNSGSGSITPIEVTAS